MKRKLNLDKSEKAIEAGIDTYVPVMGEKRSRIESILEKGRKTRNINIRISEYDLLSLKRKAEEEGIPYQTLVSSILHKYLRDRLVDEKDVVRSLHLLTNRS